MPSDGLEPSTPSLRRPVPRWHSSKDRLFVYARRWGQVSRRQPLLPRPSSRWRRDWTNPWSVL